MAEDLRNCKIYMLLEETAALRADKELQADIIRELRVEIDRLKDLNMEAAVRLGPAGWQMLIDYKKLNDASIELTIERDKLRAALLEWRGQLFVDGKVQIKCVSDSASKLTKLINQTNELLVGFERSDIPKENIDA